MNNKVFFLPALLALGLFACNSGPESPKGFSLPKGNIDQGKTVFMKYQCLTCHNLEGYEDLSIKKEFTQPVKLGGTSPKVKTYADLVTSIINPSHKLATRRAGLESVINQDGTSKMPSHNDIMTVSELIDLVAFLQPQYKVKPLQYTHYNTYHIP